MWNGYEVRIEQAPLPGVGLRLDIVLESGRRVGVIRGQDGLIELYVSDEADPDLVECSIPLNGAQAAALAELLGGSTLSHELAHLQGAAEGVAVDWIPIESGSEFAGRTLGDTQLRTRTGVSIVAVVRDGRVIPSPTPDFVFSAGDVLVAVGTADALGKAATLLGSGESVD